MRLSSRLTWMTTFSLLVLFVVGLALLGSTQLAAHGASASLKPPTKSGVASAPAGASCGVWNVVSNPNPEGSILYGVAAISMKNVWTVGGTLIEHWNGTHWNVVPGPSNEPYESNLVGVAALSANNIWAVGNYFIASSDTPQTLIEHWNGIRWNVIASSNRGPYENYLTAIATISANNIWAVGNYDSSSTISYQTLIEHWDGTRWSIISSPNLGSGDNHLNGITAFSAKDIWAVGDSRNGNAPSQTLIEHWNGTSWSVISSPNPGPSINSLSGVARIPGTSSLWAVGYNDQPGSSEQALTEFSC